MTMLQKVLKEVDSITESNADEVFGSIAKQLFRGFCIDQGGVKYRFLEIEFYYFSPVHKDLLESCERPFVYARNSEKTGTFLVHSSGLDICFEGEVKADGVDSRGGGILIRSLLRIDKNDQSAVVTGPWDCMDALINYTNGENFPRIVALENINDNVSCRSARRYNDKSTLKENRYCFYDGQYVDEERNYWVLDNQKLERYDPVTRGTKPEYHEKPWKRKDKSLRM
ncbi:hypothetical protein [Butyricimonas synergistica]|uniref:hypothetical protein n=1 Tax=Butyricimonas synergistica TaxID=544644 RepID=UPI0012DC7C83|nr:hypothetical protein [Butyricimonas synergistica]